MSNEKYGFWWEIYGNFDEYTFILIAYRMFTDILSHFNCDFSFYFCIFSLEIACMANAIALRHDESFIRHVYFDIDLATISKWNENYRNYVVIFSRELFDPSEQNAMFRNLLTDSTKNLKLLFQKSLFAGSVEAVQSINHQHSSNDMWMDEFA